MIKYNPIKSIITIVVLLLILAGLNINAQPNKRTNFWYFADSVGLDFNSGVPVEDYSGIVYGSGTNGTSIMCDTNGNLLFYSNGKHVWNNEHQQMIGGYSGSQFQPGTQGALCMPVPNSDSLYYIFTAKSFQVSNPMFYYIINMSGNSGLGSVIDKDTLLSGWDASEQLTCSYKNNKKDYWVITRKYRESKYAAYLVSESGVSSEPVLSDAPDRIPIDNNNWGYMKISYNKKYLVTCFRGNGLSKSNVEICKFNNETGDIDFLYSFKLRDIIVGNPTILTHNCEFAPSSKFMYLAGERGFDSISDIYQFDMQYIENPTLFKLSAIKIGESQGVNIQLASDGKIYCFTKSGWNLTPQNNFVGIIHEPDKYGIDCNYQPNAFWINNGTVGLPFVNFAPDFLYRFDFEGNCESDTFTFDPWFFPEPDSILWNFGDPMSGSSNTSDIPHASHKFTDGGTYEVSVHVVYPNGRVEETSREVEVEYSPEPDLGPDTTVCYAADITLDAECGDYSYLWSTGAFGTSHITVSDTGWYWVKVTSDGGCFAYDSIHISNYAAAMADTSNLIISPTTCGGSTGAIRGLNIVGAAPFNYQWIDDLGNPVATTLDLYQLPVGNYTLLVTDGNNCTTTIGTYSIVDAGDVLVDNVTFINEHCNQHDGKILVTATSGLGDMLYYSIDNGASYVQNLGEFTNLTAGSYAVRVHDSTLCEDVYDMNPVIIENQLHPQITNVQVTPETTGMNNGQINITATSQSDTIYYSNDGGVSSQINNGLFTNLSAGFYTCVVSDKFGCDTTFVVEVPESFAVTLKAVAGQAGVCPGNVAHVPLIVTNFNDVARFKATLLFDKDKLTCQGFINPNAMIQDSLQIMLFPAEGKVELNWHAPPVTLPASSNLVSLVFEANTTGGSLIEWDGSAGANVFYNSSGNQIPVDYHVGEVIIFKEVYFSLETSKNACQGDTIILQPSLWSSNGQVSYNWTLPDSSVQNTETLEINNVTTGQSGTYSLIVTDTAGCSFQSSVDVTVFETPLPEFANSDTIFADNPFDLDAGADFLSYLWSTGDTTQFIWVDTSGWYSVALKSNQGCIGKDSSYVLFISPPEIIKVYFPNAFTPNGDGLNDEFKVVTSATNISLFSLSIFNRWGALVYQTDDITQGWDGTYNGTACQSGSYVFKVTYNTSPGGASETKMGTVMLVK